MSDTEPKIDEDMKPNAESENNSTDAGQSSSTDKPPSQEEKKDSEQDHDGVKILEEVFGKATVGDTPQENGQVENPVIGPLPPSENEYDEADIVKAEEYKVQGNDFFK